MLLGAIAAVITALAALVGAVAGLVTSIRAPQHPGNTDLNATEDGFKPRTFGWSYYSIIALYALAWIVASLFQLKLHTTWANVVFGAVAVRAGLIILGVMLEYAYEVEHILHAARSEVYAAFPHAPFPVLLSVVRVAVAIVVLSLLASNHGWVSFSHLATDAYQHFQENFQLK